MTGLCEVFYKNRKLKNCVIQLFVTNLICQVLRQGAARLC
jgi:hypothetical protein